MKERVHTLKNQWDRCIEAFKYDTLIPLDENFRREIKQERSWEAARRSVTCYMEAMRSGNKEVVKYLRDEFEKANAVLQSEKKPFIPFAESRYIDSVINSSTTYRGTLRRDYFELIKKNYNGKVEKGRIISIVFLENIKDIPPKALDLSEEGDNSVKGWIQFYLERCIIYLSGVGGINAPSDCDHLFSDFQNLEEIRFNGAFHTENTTSMRYMFAGCENIKKLELNSFCTTHVTNMEGMFFDCKNLKELYMDSCNMLNVENTLVMFYGCDEKIRNAIEMENDIPNPSAS